MSCPPLPTAPRGANTPSPKDSSLSSCPITQGSQTSPSALRGSKNFPAPLQHPGVPDTHTLQTLGVPAPSQPQGSKPFPTSQRSQSLLTASSTQECTPRSQHPGLPAPSPPLQHTRVPRVPASPSKLQCPSSSLPTSSPKGSQPPRPLRTQGPSPFLPPKGSSPSSTPQHPGVPNTSYPLKGPNPSPLPHHPRVPGSPPQASRSATTHPSGTTRVSH